MVCSKPEPDLVCDAEITGGPKRFVVSLQTANPTPFAIIESTPDRTKPVR